MMQVKRYQARTLGEALGLVRADLGRDAIILETHRVRPPGIRGIFAPQMLEVSAIADTGEVRVPWDALSRLRSAEPAPQRERTDPRGQEAEAQDQREDAAAAFQPGLPIQSIVSTKAEDDQGARLSLSPIEVELDRLNGVLSQARLALQQLSHTQASLQGQMEELSISCPTCNLRIRQQSMPFSHPDSLKFGGAFEGLSASLQAAGLDPVVSELVLGHVPTAVLENGDEMARAVALQKALTVIVPTINDIEPNGNDPLVICLAGPTGVGKTTTAARLARRFAGSYRTALTTTGRSGFTSTAQLASFCARHGITFHACRGPKDLAEHLRRDDQRFDVVLVDTPGVACSDASALEHLRHIHALTEVTHMLLVASASIHVTVVDQLVSALGLENLDGLILTKLDEAGQPGVLISSAVTLGLPLAFLSNSHVLTSNLEVATPKTVADLVLSHAALPIPAGAVK